MPDQYTQLTLIATEKPCTLCGETKPLTDFYYRRKEARYAPECKKCSNANSKAYRLAHPERCAEHLRRWREENPDRHRELRRRWKRENADKLRAMRQSPEGKERERIVQRRYLDNHKAEVAARQREYRERNRPVILAKKRKHGREYYVRNRERVTESHRAYRMAHPDDTLNRKRLRRARLLGVGGVVSEAEWQERIAYFNGCCAYCGQPMSVPTQDHMTPISRGGRHVIENIVPACGSCNSRKHAKNLLEYLIYERG